jgi:hypothetical protein
MRALPDMRSILDRAAGNRRLVCVKVKYELRLIFMRMNQLKPIKDKNRHSLGVSGTLLSISVFVQHFGSDRWGLS